MKKFLALILAIATMAQAAVLAAEGETQAGNEQATPTEDTTNVQVTALGADGYMDSEIYFTEDSYYIIDGRFTDFNSNGIYKATLRKTLADGGDINLLPVRTFAEAIGASIYVSDVEGSDYDIYRIINAGRTIAVDFRAGMDFLNIYNISTVNDEEIYEFDDTKDLVTPAVEYNNTSYIPFRDAISAILGVDAKSSEAYIGYVPSKDQKAFGIKVDTEGKESLPQGLENMFETMQAEVAHPVSIVKADNTTKTIWIANSYEKNDIRNFAQYLKNENLENCLFGFEGEEWLYTNEKMIEALNNNHKLLSIIPKGKAAAYKKTDKLGAQKAVYVKCDVTDVTNAAYRTTDFKYTKNIGGVDYYYNDEAALSDITYTLSYNDGKSAEIIKIGSELYYDKDNEKLGILINALSANKQFSSNSVSAQMYIQIKEAGSSETFAEGTYWIVVAGQKKNEVTGVNEETIITIFSWDSQKGKLSDISYGPQEFKKDKKGNLMIGTAYIKSAFEQEN